MRFQVMALAAASAVALGHTGNVAFAESSIFELRITNSTDRALTFRLHDGQSKHARLVHDGNKVSEYTILAGSYDVVGVQATGSKCSPNCGGCSPTVGKVYAYYDDDKGDEQRNNYYEPSVEFLSIVGLQAPNRSRLTRQIGRSIMGPAREQESLSTRKKHRPTLIRSRILPKA